MNRILLNDLKPENEVDSECENEKLIKFTFTQKPHLAVLFNATPQTAPLCPSNVPTQSPVSP